MEGGDEEGVVLGVIGPADFDARIVEVSRQRQWDEPEGGKTGNHTRGEGKGGSGLVRRTSARGWEGIR